MKFYDFELAPSPRRVRIFMAEKGVEVPTVQVNLREKEQLNPEFRAINQRCTVPVLELDDGTRICEAVAICRYLEETHPEPPLMGTDARDKAVVAMWEHWAEFDGFFAAAEALRNSAERLKGRALTGPVDVQQIPELAERGRGRVERFFTGLDERLADSEYLAGAAYTIADITAQVAVDFAGWVQITIADGQENLKRWHAQVSARPSAKA